MTRAVVLGGGGVTGVSWSYGLLTGLGLDLAEADLVVGTSAGSVVGAQAANGRLAESYAAQLAGPGSERAAHAAPGVLPRFVAALVRSWRDPVAFRARVGAVALAADTVPEPERRAMVAARLTAQDWPATRLRIVAVDALTGALRAFDRDSGVPLVDAVTASCAIPGMWPPATVDGRRHVDGGIASAVNAQLAAGSGRVLVIAPITIGGGPVPSVRTEVAALERGGSRVLVVSPDRAAKRAAGRNPGDPGRRAPAARAGHAQGSALATAVHRFWD